MTDQFGAESDRPLVVLIDDAEALADSPLEPGLRDLISRAGDGAVAVVVSARSDEVALAFRGLAAPVRRAGTGILLAPSAADGELLGVRLPRVNRQYPPGRGVLVARQPAVSTLAHGRAALAIQIAL
jgi:S-DNA-T family DNA segregation ATPase FtsK/SpoIIIE